MRVTRELNLINKHIHRQNREAGEAIVWYEFIPLGAGSDFDDLYDESPRGTKGLKYKQGVTIPTVYIEEIEDNNRAIDDARMPLQNVRIVMAMDQVIRSGLTHPEEYQPHLNDLFFYDGRYYNVIDYRVRGRLRDDVLLAVEGNESYIDQERMNDLLDDQVPKIQDWHWPDTFPA